MAGRESLENLIEGLAGAVVEAQRRIEHRQIENFLSYFDEHNRPRKIDIKVPSLHPQAKSHEDAIYRVPLLPLVASSLLRIKEVEISFDADLLGVDESEDSGEKDEAAEEKKPWMEQGKPSTVTVDMGGSMFRKKGGKAHVVLKVEGRELSEGMARLIDRLVRVQGEIQLD